MLYQLTNSANICSINCLCCVLRDLSSFLSIFSILIASRLNFKLTCFSLCTISRTLPRTKLVSLLASNSLEVSEANGVASGTESYKVCYILPTTKWEGQANEVSADFFYRRNLLLSYFFIKNRGLN